LDVGILDRMMIPAASGCFCFCGFTSAERSESSHDFGDFTHHQKQDPNVPPGFGVTNFQEFS